MLPEITEEIQEEPTLAQQEEIAWNEWLYQLDDSDDEYNRNYGLNK